jgi:CRISPR-associated endonuclease/helicase Cas3
MTESGKKYYAHSADSERGIPAQSYSEHIEGVVRRCEHYIKDMPPLLKEVKDILASIVLPACEYHDLGKLADKNQEILSGNGKGRSLALPHSDAGSAYMLHGYDVSDAIRQLSAILIYSHHRGLPDLHDECIRKDPGPLRIAKASEDSNKNLEHYLSIHKTELKSKTVCQNSGHELRGYSIAPFVRIAMSMLADADHSDTAANYGNFVEGDVPKLRAAERLKALDAYVAKLSKGQPEDNGRNKARREMYERCRDADTKDSILYCDSPVGTGKTTAIMAHLLKTAEERGLRRIVVVMPFTNIISQAVEVYRKALVLEGENPERVVAEVHHKAEYEDYASRQFSALWNAPIVVTTAVQFFETMASARPATLRKLHCLPGSAVFIDEAHAALPPRLLPLAWRWLKEFASTWGCHIVMASGSLNKFWELKDFDADTPKIPNLLPDNFMSDLKESEEARVTFKRKETPIRKDKLCEWLITLPGPRIVVLNTVHSAAAVASKLADMAGRDKVEHLSTALTPEDREVTLERVKKRLKDQDDTDWTLVATSCVEAGVDLSFKTGVREMASLTSLLQLAGRVNRNKECDKEDAVIWSIELIYEDGLTKHPQLEGSSAILKNFFIRGLISPDHCTAAMKEELDMAPVFGQKRRTILQLDKAVAWETVDKEFKVIDSNTVTVVIGEKTRDALAARDRKIDWRELQKKSVQIWTSKATQLGAEPIVGFEEIKYWPYKYDTFIGYMAGVLDNDEIDENGFLIL